MFVTLKNPSDFFRSGKPFQNFGSVMRQVKNQSKTRLIIIEYKSISVFADILFHRLIIIILNSNLH